MRSHGHRRKTDKRRGALTVEMALVLPLLFLIFFGGWEFSRVAMLRHTADNAAYEACRVGILPGATSSEVRTRAANLMASVGANSVTIEVAPAVIDDSAQEVTVRLRIPLDANTYGTRKFFAGKTIVREMTMTSEASKFD